MGGKKCTYIRPALDSDEYGANRCEASWDDSVNSDDKYEAAQCFVTYIYICSMIELYCELPAVCNIDTSVISAGFCASIHCYLLQSLTYCPAVTAANKALLAIMFIHYQIYHIINYLRWWTDKSRYRNAFSATSWSYSMLLVMTYKNSKSKSSHKFFGLTPKIWPRNPLFWKGKFNTILK